MRVGLTLLVAIIPWLIGKGQAERLNMLKMACLVNQERTQRGLQPLRIDASLMDVATGHSRYQSRVGVMTHDDDAGGVGDRVHQNGFDWSTVAENVAEGYPDEDRAMIGWMNSPGHRANILDPNYTHFGAARKEDYWTQVFARPHSQYKAANTGSVSRLQPADAPVCPTAADIEPELLARIQDENSGNLSSDDMPTSTPLHVQPVAEPSTEPAPPTTTPLHVQPVAEPNPEPVPPTTGLSVIQSESEAPLMLSSAPAPEVPGRVSQEGDRTNIPLPRPPPTYHVTSFHHNRPQQSQENKAQRGTSQTPAAVEADDERGAETTDSMPMTAPVRFSPTVAPAMDHVASAEDPLIPSTATEDAQLVAETEVKSSTISPMHYHPPPLESAGMLSQETMEVSLGFAPQDHGGKPFLKWLHSGLFDGSHFLLRRSTLPQPHRQTPSYIAHTTRPVGIRGRNGPTL
ncbi:hypothetical protein IWQ60_010096 [Tieghemiomyces parasiticus]|uniref:SCP domain-containing protein n=1 Tax=Tieghemiomyces parasiticus TaxID=78921 RepID=A0A9W8DK39_9FUNG|nr:hypothetical protein IWQ60_010096 [Tieghemiomyces parasiticus]